MYTVILKSAPAQKNEHVVRVVHKHNRKMTHHEHEGLVKRVMAGSEEIVATYEDEHAAHNVVAELAYYGAAAEVRSAQ